MALFLFEFYITYTILFFNENVCISYQIEMRLKNSHSYIFSHSPIQKNPPLLDSEGSI